GRHADSTPPTYQGTTHPLAARGVRPAHRAGATPVPAVLAPGGGRRRGADGHHCHRAAVGKLTVGGLLRRAVAHEGHGGGRGLRPDVRPAPLDQRRPDGPLLLRGGAGDQARAAVGRACLSAPRRAAHRGGAGRDAGAGGAVRGGELGHARHQRVGRANGDRHRVRHRRAGPAGQAGPARCQGVRHRAGRGGRYRCGARDRAVLHACGQLDRPGCGGRLPGRGARRQPAGGAPTAALRPAGARAVGGGAPVRRACHHCRGVAGAGDPGRPAHRRAGLPGPRPRAARRVSQGQPARPARPHQRGPAVGSDLARGGLRAGADAAAASGARAAPVGRVRHHATVRAGQRGGRAHRRRRRRGRVGPGDAGRAAGAGARQAARSDGVQLAGGAPGRGGAARGRDVAPRVRRLVAGGHWLHHVAVRRRTGLRRRGDARPREGRHPRGVGHFGSGRLAPAAPHGRHRRGRECACGGAGGAPPRRRL
ncbi:MAG: Na+/H+ antiporter NhaA type, partial [uncultured Chloroflexi bacterium]